MHTRPNVKSAVLFMFKSTYLLFLIAITVGVLVLFLFWSIERTSNNLIDSSTNQFRVTGEAKRFVKPDMANIVLSAVMRGKDVREVQTKASEATNKALVAIKALGVLDEEIKTSGYSILPEYEYVLGKQNLIGYNATITLTIKTKLLDKVGNIVDGATASGINSVTSLNFYIENQDQIQDELKLEAIENAKVKATELASTSGLRLGKLKNVEDGMSYYPYQYSMLNASDSVGATREATPAPIDLTVEPGESELTSSVTLVYQID